MGTGVLVDGLDFSTTKMLVGRTFSYSDTQRHRVGTNYLQLKVNSPQGITHPVATNQRDGQMAVHVDVVGQNPHVNYEPSIHGGLKESPRHDPIHQPEIHGKLTRSVIDRRNDYAQGPGPLRHDERLGARRLGAEPGQPAERLRARRAGAHALAFLPRARRLRLPGGPGTRDGPPRKCVGSSRWPNRCSPRRTSSGWKISARTVTISTRASTGRGPVPWRTIRPGPRIS